MISEATLRNFYKHEIKSFFKEHNVERLDERLRSLTRSSYLPYINVTKEEISSGNITKTEFDSFLKENLFYNKNNYHYIFELESFFIESNSKFNINEFINSNPELLFNQPLFDLQLNKDFQLCTSFFELNNCEQVTKVNFLLKVDEVEHYREKINLFSAITIDIEKKLILIRFNLPRLEKSSHEKAWLLDYIKTQLTKNIIFQPLKIQFSSFNETHANKTIYNLFNNLSTEVETIMDKQLESDTEDLIDQFLKGVNVTDLESDYVKQIKSVIYQDISRSSSTKLFKNGWVFRFVFREGRHTRASSATEHYNPIYSSKIYWNLKELIIESGEMIEVGFHWYNVKKSDKTPIIVKLESKNNAIISMYYNKGIKKSTVHRKEQEDFVLHKIRKNLYRE
ncbi:hypothetical protein ACW4EZ_10750 [Bacillus toyonensis]|nr:hypothetical protein [Bacillus cereus]OTX40629.1 hypothetical protein BK717_04825 [Bacillus thuringiensis serovar malayensis]OUB05048.1 hypothetical protein BK709_19390 [Bacillus thuringiensis serovar shandongiensis]